MLLPLNITLVVLLTSCGLSNSSSQESGQLASSSLDGLSSQNLMYLSVESSDAVSKELSGVISGDAEAELVLVVKIDDVDLSIDLSSSDQESLSVNLANTRVDTRSNTRVDTKNNGIGRDVIGSSSTKKNAILDTNKTQDKEIKAKPSLLSKLKKSENEIEKNVAADAILNEAQAVYQGAYLPHSGLVHQRLLYGFEAPRFTVDADGNATYDGSRADPHLYTTASLKITTAVRQSNFEKDHTSRQTGFAEQVVFKLKVRKNQGVDKNKNEGVDGQGKLVDVYGKISPDQILGYYSVRNGDIGEFKPNLYVSKTVRTITKIRSNLDSFFQKISLEDDEAPVSTRRVRNYNPRIPGTLLHVSRFKMRE